MEYEMYVLECVLTSGSVVRMQFSSKTAATEAQGKLSAAMSKGKYQSEEVVHVASDGSEYDIRASEIMSVSVNDTAAWTRMEKSNQEYRESLDLPIRKTI